MFRAWMLPACVSVTLACSLLVDSDDLAGTVAPGTVAPADASSIDSGASSEDASTDSPMIVPDAAGNDAGTRFCDAPRAAGIFCLDFDGPTVLEGVTPLLTDGGVIVSAPALDAGLAPDGGPLVSPPSVMRASVSGVTDGGDIAFATHTFLSGDLTASVAWSMKLDALPATDAAFARINLGASYYVLGYGVAAKQLVLTQADSVTEAEQASYAIAYTPTANTWLRFRIDIRGGGTSPGGTVWIDGMFRLNDVPLVGVPAGSGERGFGIGLVGGAATSADFDNVLFDVKPLP